MKDLFSGSLGRLNSHGGSRMFTTPNTVYVPPDYQIETDVPSIAEFVTCSLDGRLWVFRRSRRYYVAVLKWDAETQRLVFVSTTILNGETVIKRGVDWILTDKSLILSSDDEPYISRTEYASDDTTYIDSINQSYSFFPELNTWQRIQNDEISCVHGSPFEELQTLTTQNIFPAPFYSFNHFGDGIDISFDDTTFFKVHCENGQIYALNKYSCGIGYLLPYVFHQNGVYAVQCFVSRDFINREFTVEDNHLTLDENDGWCNLCIASWKTDSVCVFTPENQDSIICKKAKNSQVTTLPQCEQIDFSADNGVIFFDGLTGSNLMLNNNDVSFFRDNLFYECRGLNQWIAPSKKVDTISSQSVISSFDNGTFATYMKGGFYRESLTKKTLPLSAKIYSGKRLSLHETNINNLKSISVNTLTTNCKSNNTYVNYDDVFLPIIDIKLIAKFENPHTINMRTEDGFNELRRYVPQVTEHYKFRLGFHSLVSPFRREVSFPYLGYSGKYAKLNKETLESYHYLPSADYSDGVFLIYEFSKQKSGYYAYGVDYYVFYDTSSHLTFLFNAVAVNEIHTSRPAGSLPLWVLNDRSSYITDTEGNEICLRSIHVILQIDTDTLIVFQTEINPSFMSKIWEKEGKFKFDEMDLPQ